MIERILLFPVYLTGYLYARVAYAWNSGMYDANSYRMKQTQEDIREMLRTMPMGPIIRMEK